MFKVARSRAKISRAAFEEAHGVRTPPHHGADAAVGCSESACSPTKSASRFAFGAMPLMIAPLMIHWWGKRTDKGASGTLLRKAFASRVDPTWGGTEPSARRVEVSSRYAAIAAAFAARTPEFADHIDYLRAQMEAHNPRAVLALELLWRHAGCDGARDCLRAMPELDEFSAKATAGDRESILALNAFFAARHTAARAALHAVDYRPYFPMAKRARGWEVVAALAPAAAVRAPHVVDWLGRDLDLAPFAAPRTGEAPGIGEAIACAVAHTHGHPLAKGVLELHLRRSTQPNAFDAYVAELSAHAFDYVNDDFLPRIYRPRVDAPRVVDTPTPTGVAAPTEQVADMRTIKMLAAQAMENEDAITQLAHLARAEHNSAALLALVEVDQSDVLPAPLRTALREHLRAMPTEWLIDVAARDATMMFALWYCGTTLHCESIRTAAATLDIKWHGSRAVQGNPFSVIALHLLADLRDAASERNLADARHKAQLILTRLPVTGVDAAGAPRLLLQRRDGAPMSAWHAYAIWLCAQHGNPLAQAIALGMWNTLLPKQRLITTFTNFRGLGTDTGLAWRS